MSLAKEIIDLCNEAMFITNIAVRFKKTGELEGFSGSSLKSAKDAESIANDKAFKKAKEFGIDKSELEFLAAKDFKALSSKEKKELKSDWDLSSKGQGEF